MLEPRPYQVEGKDFGVLHSRIILGDEMGLGKTGQVYLMLKEWHRMCMLEAHRGLRVLVVCGKNAEYVWHREASRWGYHELPVIIEGKGTKAAAAREMLWGACARKEINFACVTRAALKLDMKKGYVLGNWDVLVVDEAHRDANHKTQNWKAVKILAGEIKRVVLVTGNPMRRGPQNLWGLLNILYPKTFSSYWKWVYDTCFVEKTRFGLEILGSKDSKATAYRLRHVMIRRTKKMVGHFAKTREFVPIEMSPRQAFLYREFQVDLTAELMGGHLQVVSSALGLIMKQRQLLCSPKCLSRSEDDYGAGIEHIIEMLDDAEDKHMVIFCPFRSGLEVMHERLVIERYDPKSLFFFWGGMGIDELREATEGFKRTRGIALVTVAFAESFDLEPATWGVFLGYEWDPSMNLQAEDRLDRMTHQNMINLYYLEYQDTIDSELIRPALDDKAMAIFPTLRSIEGLRKLAAGLEPRALGSGTKP